MAPGLRLSQRPEPTTPLRLTAPTKPRPLRSNTPRHRTSVRPDRHGGARRSEVAAYRRTYGFSASAQPGSGNSGPKNAT
jgi:hypothetical protein